jgi:hypothetical protein
LKPIAATAPEGGVPMPAGATSMYTTSVVANDGSPGGGKALAGAIKLARETSAALHMLRVEELPRFPASIDEVAEENDEANHRVTPVIDAAQAQATAAG